MTKKKDKLEQVIVFFEKTPLFNSWINFRNLVQESDQHFLQGETLKNRIIEQIFSENTTYNRFDLAFKFQKDCCDLNIILHNHVIELEKQLKEFLSVYKKDIDEIMQENILLKTNNDRYTHLESVALKNLIFIDMLINTVKNKKTAQSDLISIHENLTLWINTRRSWGNYKNG